MHCARFWGRRQFFCHKAMQMTANEQRVAQIFVQIMHRNRTVASGQAQYAAKPILIMNGLGPAIAQSLLFLCLPQCGSLAEDFFLPKNR